MNAEEITSAMLKKLGASELPGGLRLAPIDADTWEEVAPSILADAFEGRHSIDPTALLEEAPRARAEALDALLVPPPVSHRLAFFDGEKIVGVFRGRQVEQARYRMSVTALSEPWRGRGVYGAFLEALLDACDQAGFVEVVSRHHVDNNSVLVAKLKAGFVISGFEMSARYGLLVTLTHRFAPSIRALYSKRVSGE